MLDVFLKFAYKIEFDMMILEAEIEFDILIMESKIEFDIVILETRGFVFRVFSMGPWSAWRHSRRPGPIEKKQIQTRNING